MGAMRRKCVADGARVEGRTLLRQDVASASVSGVCDLRALRHTGQGCRAASGAAQGRPACALRILISRYVHGCILPEASCATLQGVGPELGRAAALLGAMAATPEPATDSSVAYLLGDDRKQGLFEGYKVYMFGVYKASGLPFCYWELRRFYDRLAIKTAMGRWLNFVQLPRVAGRFPALGVEPPELRSSLKALEATRKAGRRLVDDDDGPHVAEWVCSTKYMVASLLDWATNLR